MTDLVLRPNFGAKLSLEQDFTVDERVHNCRTDWRTDASWRSSIQSQIRLRHMLSFFKSPLSWSQNAASIRALGDCSRIELSFSSDSENGSKPKTHFLNLAAEKLSRHQKSPVLRSTEEDDGMQYDSNFSRIEELIKRNTFSRDHSILELQNKKVIVQEL